MSPTNRIHTRVLADCQRDITIDHTTWWRYGAAGKGRSISQHYMYLTMSYSTAGVYKIQMILILYKIKYLRYHKRKVYTNIF